MSAIYQKIKAIAAGCLAAMMLTACGGETAETLAASGPEASISEIGRSYRELWLAAEKEADGTLTQAAIDGIEECLLAKGYAVLDTDAVYPTHLGNAEAFYGFWEAVEKGETAELGIVRVKENGGFSYLLFQNQGQTPSFTRTDVVWNGENLPQEELTETFEIYDWAVTEWDVFYYQIYPEDFHYDKYAQILLKAADRELYDLNRKYILPIGYHFVNIFLQDWQEGDWENLSFNDTFEMLYYAKNGTYVPTELIQTQEGENGIKIPAAVFEETVWPYFSISLEQFRELAFYEEAEDCYLWWPVQTNQMVHYPRLEPNVTGYTENTDGTITLTVDVASPDLMTNRLFSHEVTIRILPDGGYQYVGNRVTDVGTQELPPSQPRWTLNEA